jgi:hypothetical protein
MVICHLLDSEGIAKTHLLLSLILKEKEVLIYHLLDSGGHAKIHLLQSPILTNEKEMQICHLLNSNKNVTINLRLISLPLADHVLKYLGTCLTFLLLDEHAVILRFEMKILTQIFHPQKKIKKNQLSHL